MAKEKKDVAGTAVPKAMRPPKPPKEPKAPKPPKVKAEKPPKDEQNGVVRPSKGVTKNIWDIADKLSAELNRPPTREEVIIACTSPEHGINFATASTQYARWRHYYGLKGVLADPIKQAERDAKVKAKEERIAARAEAALAKKAEKEAKKAERAEAKLASDAEKAAKDQAKLEAKAQAKADKEAKALAKAQAKAEEPDEDEDEEVDE